MRLSTASLDWIAQVTHLLGNYSKKLSYYTALEGLPCAGKTIAVNSLQDEQEVYGVNELRLPPNQESCTAYLNQEPLRSTHITTIHERKGRVLGDRSVVSTLAHKATLLTYEGPAPYGDELKKINELIRHSSIVLPLNMVILDVSIPTSRRRQEFRDRDKLEGRLWYDPVFLEIMASCTDLIIADLYGNSVHRIDSNVNSIDEVRKLVKDFLERVYR